jgi:hypothetical protein
MNTDTRGNPDNAHYYQSILTRIPMGHWGKPEDFKGPAVFLASDASSYVSGETIVVRCDLVFNAKRRKADREAGRWRMDGALIAVVGRAENPSKALSFP